MHHQTLVGAPSTGPSAARAALDALVPPDENVVAALEVDLDAQRRYGQGQLLLTESRLLAVAAGSTEVLQWPLQAALALHHHDHGGVGSLELHDAGGLLATWSFTLGHNVQALRLVKQFELQRDRSTASAALADDPLLCPTTA